MALILNIPAYKEQTALVVILGSPSKSLLKDIKTDLEPNEQSKVPNLFENVVYVVPDGYDARGHPRPKDCTRNVYNAAGQANRAGWRRILVVDSLTCEQQSEELRPGRRAEPSLVLVQTTKSSTTQQDERVIAKRVNFETAKVSYFRDADFEIPRSIEGYAGGGRDHASFFYDGMPLYDPDKPVFEPLTEMDQTKKQKEDEKADRVIQRIRGMPAEVAKMIEDAYYAERDPFAMTAAPAKVQMKREIVLVHVVIQMTTTELTELETALNEQLSHLEGDVKCKLYPWRGNEPASRRNVWQLYERYVKESGQGTFSSFIFVGWAGYDRTNRSGDVCLIRWDYHLPMLVERVSIRNAFEMWENQTESNYDKPSWSSQINDVWGNKADTPANEMAIDYDMPFYWDPPLFVSLADGIAPPIFMMTKHLTEAEMQMIKDEIAVVGDEDDSFMEDDDTKHYALVPWEREDDARMDDVWEMAWECTRYRGFGSTQCPIFIDRQSAIDKTLMMTTLAYTNEVNGDGSGKPLEDEEFGPYSGFMHGRMPGRRVHIEWCSFDTGNIGFQESFDEYGVHYRPGVVPKDNWVFAD